MLLLNGLLFISEPDTLAVRILVSHEILLHGRQLLGLLVQLDVMQVLPRGEHRRVLQLA